MKIFNLVIKQYHIKLSSFLLRIRRWYYFNLFNICGRNLTVFGRINVKNPQHISVGSNVSINDGVYLNGWEGIVIGNNVALSAGCIIVSTGLVSEKPKLGEKRRHIGGIITLGDNVQIGAGATILAGVSIGENTIIGAGSVVTKNIPSNVVAFGVPAKIYRQL